LAALARAIGFVPLVGTTAIATGVYGPVGMTFIFAAALFVNNPIIAAVLGFVIITDDIDKEIQSLQAKMDEVRKRLRNMLMH